MDTTVDNKKQPIRAPLCLFHAALAYAAAGRTAGSEVLAAVDAAADELRAAAKRYARSRYPRCVTCEDRQANYATAAAAVALVCCSHPVHRTQCERIAGRETTRLRCLDCGAFKEAPASPWRPDERTLRPHLSQHCGMDDHAHCPRETTLGTAPCDCPCHSNIAAPGKVTP